MIAPSTYIPRHHHRQGYVSLVLEGNYVETGDNGRFHAAPAAILVHHAWDAHQDLTARRGEVRIVNFDLPHDWPPQVCWGVVSDPDTVVRLSERDPVEALAELRRQLCPVEALTGDWTDVLARRLLAEDPVSLGDWARQNDLDPASVSRGFRRVFGAPPAAFRLHNRTKAALRTLVASNEALCSVAAGTGFSDQAHMTRAVTRLTGHLPGQWRNRMGGARS